MWIYYFLFFFTAFIVVTPLPKKIKAILSIIILVLFAGTRYHVDNDYFLYNHHFKFIETNLADFQARIIPLEYSMFFIPNTLKFFLTTNDDVAKGSFLVFAFLGVVTKLIAIQKYSQFYFLSFILYTSYLFLGQEMTTIRAGVAAGIFLLSIDNLEKDEYIQFFLKILLCLFFHNSSIIYILVWILFKFKLSIKSYTIMMVVSFIIAIAKINLLTLLFLDKVFPRVKSYIEALEWTKEGPVNLFNFRILIAMFFIIVFLINYEKLKKIKYFDILFKIHMFSVATFFALSTSAIVFSLRTFDMFSVVQILLYPYMLFVFKAKNRVIGWSVVIVVAILQIYYAIDISNNYTPYESWLI
ncbi:MULTISPECIES: EpsG family protein [Chryseobacterium]|uniref:EpsG family protein n=1 Tax=Chryseobacterium TaxID=59732 RepID=UPI0024E21EA2|nr:EpsG family protein [Chryseobacterium sp.]